MTSYSELQRKNAQETSALVGRFLQSLSSSASAAALAPAMMAANLPKAVIAGATRAVLLADLAMMAWVATRTGRPAATAGLVLPVETEDAITAGVETIVSDFEESDNADELLMRSERLANAAPLSAGQDAYQAAAEAHGIEAWIRRLTGRSSRALCRSWADGRARPMTVRMVRHPGCDCVAEPVEIGPDFLGKLITGHGLGGVETTFARPGLTFSRTTFVPARSA